ncbi:MAG: alanine-tRNA synthetase second additional domain-containing protein [Ruminococcaceae bacterium]|nr:alanine-tRNA synthetase second additional domain-containing protein [Oscillospiraceae bacterium]
MKHNRQVNHILSSYFAPRGQSRMYALGMQLAQLYLQPTDKLIGVIGEAGSGKSALLRGMFPGLELTNDDDGVYIRPLPLLDINSGFSFFSPHTYHVDIRFENGFTQMSVLAEAITEALHCGRRVIVEHFDLVYPFLNFNANLLIGVGEQILISRPTLFGPDPKEIKDIVYQSLPYRLMAHTAEDLCELCMPKELVEHCTHDDVKHGFVISFPDNKPELDIAGLEQKVNELIAQNLPITYVDRGHVCIGTYVHPCTGPRMHVSNTGMVKNFHLLGHFIYDHLTKSYMLVGCVGDNAEKELRKLDAQQEKQSDLIYDE